MRWSGWMKSYKTTVTMEDVRIDTGVYIKKNSDQTQKLFLQNRKIICLSAVQVKSSHFSCDRQSSYLESIVGVLETI